MRDGNIVPDKNLDRLEFLAVVIHVEDAERKYMGQLLFCISDNERE